MKVLACASEKGGAGKTTTVVNVAAALGEMGHRCLVVDLDSQGTASRWLGARDEGRRLLEALTEGAALLELVVPTPAVNVDLVPSGRQVGRAEPLLAGAVGADGAVKRALASLPRRWDVILLDCPPSLGLVTTAALTAAAGVLVPVEAHGLAVEGLVGILKTVHQVQEYTNPALRLVGILACRVDARERHALEVVEFLRQTYGDKVLQAIVRASVRLAEAPGHALPITMYDPSGRGAEDHRAAAAELWQRMQATEGRR